MSAGNRTLPVPGWGGCLEGGGEDAISTSLSGGAEVLRHASAWAPAAGGLGLGAAPLGRRDDGGLRGGSGRRALHR